MKVVPMHLVCLEIGKDSGPEAERCFDALGSSWHYSAVARTVVGRETRGLVSVFRPGAIDEDPLVILSVLTRPEQTRTVANHLIAELNLTVPGAGSLSVLPVQVGLPETAGDESLGVGDLERPAGERNVLLLEGIVQIVTIVQRGEGTNLSKAALNMGQSVPSVCFGIGMGLREKLGLIRLTFPRDKEIVRLMVGVDEAEEVFGQLSEAGKLDQPGKGFIYLSPLEFALPNTLLFRGAQRHAATMEQMIQAIDGMQGGATWRRKRIGERASGGSKRTYLTGMVEITARIQDGYGHALVLSAMSAGAAGATMSKCRRVAGSGTTRTAVGMEEMYMIVPEAAAPKILEVLEEHGLFREGLNGSVMVRPVSRAFTYLGK